MQMAARDTRTPALTPWPSLATLAALTSRTSRTSTPARDTSPRVAPTRPNRSSRLSAVWLPNANANCGTTTRSSNTTEVGLPLLYNFNTYTHKAPQKSNTKTQDTQGTTPSDLFFCRHSVTSSFSPSFHIFLVIRFLHCLRFIRFCIYYTAQGRAKTHTPGLKDIEWERAILDFYFKKGRPFFTEPIRAGERLRKRGPR